jgi:hypothetical protein
MYSQFRHRRVWDDIGWKTPTAIIPHVGIEGTHLSRTWDTQNLLFLMHTDHGDAETKHISLQ